MEIGERFNYFKYLEYSLFTWHIRDIFRYKLSVRQIKLGHLSTEYIDRIRQLPLEIQMIAAVCNCTGKENV